MAGFVVLDITQEDYDKQIRTKAIDEFAELMKEKLKDMQYINQDIGCQYCAREQTIKEINEIAEQMKAGGVNELEQSK